MRTLLFPHTVPAACFHSSLPFMHYDHISFHTDETYPTGLPAHHAAHHIGYYYAWAVSQNLHSPAAEALPDFGSLKNGTLSGSDFVLAQLGGGIDDTCFNGCGNRFTRYYYADEDEGYGHFLSDYFTALNLADFQAFYHIPDRPEIQARLNPVFQAAFDAWRGTLSQNPNPSYSDA